MTGAAAKASDAADAVLAWLADQPARRPAASPPAGSADGEGGAPAAANPGTDAAVVGAPGLIATPRDRRSASPALDGPPLRLPTPDWLHHRVTVSGPAAEVGRFRQAAAGAGGIPWQLDFEQMEEDYFHLLVAQGRRSLSVAGARIFARQLRAAVERRHALAVAQVGRSRACPFDLHALLPVPNEILLLGPDDPQAVAWLWQNWGTTDALRQVAEETMHRPVDGNGGEDAGAAFRLQFWSADWTPWRALAELARRWPTLRFEARPSYDVS